MTTTTERKAWQKGYDLPLLRAGVAPFKAADKGFTRGAFTAFKENALADAMAAGRYLALHERMTVTNMPSEQPPLAAVVWSVVTHRRAVRDFTGGVRGLMKPGDLYVSRLGYTDEAAAVDLLETLLADHPKGAVWVRLWEESTADKRIAASLGLHNIAVKIPASSELVGVYANGRGTGLGSTPVPVSDLYGLRRLPLFPDSSTLAEALAEVRGVTEDLEAGEFADHYSGYNKGHAWRALALRGYGGPADIQKPAEMSKAWKDRNPGWRDLLCHDTVLYDRLPSCRALANLVPGEHQRVRLMLLAPGGGELTRHADITDPEAGTADGCVARVHIPLVTNDQVWFSSWTLEGVRYTRNFRVGDVWYLDTRKPHTAVNNGDTPRLHLVVDTYGGPALRGLLEAGLS